MENKTVQRAGQATNIDEGLRSHMMKVYNYMTYALVVTAIASYLILETSLIQLFFSISQKSVSLSPLGYIALFSPLAMVFFISAKVNSASIKTIKILFYAFATLMGISLAPTLLMYTGESVIKVFLITSATFGSMSLYGYTTKRSLTNIGSFLMMGLIGIIIAMIVNIFMQSDSMGYAISLIAIAIFVGLTAYDTQKIKNAYNFADTEDLAERKIIMGALNIYLDFINLFIHLLRIMGSRR